MANPEVQVDGFGWNIDLRMVEQGSPIDISTATLCDYVSKKPDGTRMTVTAVFVTDGSDGKLRHLVAQGEIDVVGTWQIQTHVVTPTQDLWSRALVFEVKGNL